MCKESAPLPCLKATGTTTSLQCSQGTVRKYNVLMYFLLRQSGIKNALPFAEEPHCLDRFDLLNAAKISNISHITKNAREV